MIQDFKDEFEKQLPPEEDVINRNKHISSVYAQYYLENQDIFKWAGMAAFAYNHIGIGLLPYHIKGPDLLSLEDSCRSRCWTNDFNLYNISTIGSMMILPGLIRHILTEAYHNSLNL